MIMETRELALDTSQNGLLTVSVSVRGKTYTRHADARHGSSQQLLREITAVCTDAGIPLSSLTGISVSQTGESFTGLRVGAVVGQTIGWLLGIPVNGHSALDPVELTYKNDRWA